MYRVQKFDATTTGMHWQIHKDAAADWRGMRRADGRGDRARASIRSPPTRPPRRCPSASTSSCSRASCAASRSRWCGARRSTSRCRPRRDRDRGLHREQGELRDEGPFGDHTGYYTPPSRSRSSTSPRSRCAATRSTRRSSSACRRQEDAWLGKATERLFLPAVRMTMPEVVDYDLPVAGAFHNLCIVSIRKGYPGHARKVMHAIWGTGPAVADEGGRGGGRRRRRPRLRPGDVAGRRERRSGARRRARRTGRSTISTTPRRCSSTAASSASTRRRRGRRRGTSAAGRSGSG